MTLKQMGLWLEFLADMGVLQRSTARMVLDTITNGDHYYHTHGINRVYKLREDNPELWLMFRTKQRILGNITGE